MNMMRRRLPLTLTLSPQAGRGDGDGAAASFSPLAGRRCRQADEGQHDTSIGGLTSPSSGPSGHLLPAGEKRERTSGSVNMLRRLLMAVILALSVFAPLPAFAVNPDEVLADPVLEQRARNISAELRCLVCQNQSIDDSNADLARDLRLIVRQRIVGGDTDEQVMDYVVSRYGEFVLLKPRVSAKTYVLWGAPAALLVIGAFAALVYARGRNRPAPERLSPEEEARLKALIED